MLNEGITESGQEILKEGYLVKQGHVVKNWKRRWFVLTAGSIDYFETQGGVQKGRILLDNVTISLDVDALGKEHCFGLFHAERKPYFLVAQSPGEVVAWIKAIRDDYRVGLLDFDMISLLGRGNFGKVMKVQHKETGVVHAMKILRKDQLEAKQHDIQHTLTERRLLQKIKHPFVVGLHYAFQTEERLYLVMDYVAGGDMYYHLKNTRRFPEDTVRIWAAQMVLAIGYLHKLSIVYRDLKPENLLLDVQGNLHLTDFGLSKIQEDPTKPLHTFCGTPYYLAPEIVQVSKTRGYGKAVDWWAIGVLMYELLTGQPPFQGANLQGVYSAIVHHPHSRVMNELRKSGVSAGAQALIIALLNRKPAERLGSGPTDAEEIRSHPYFGAEGEAPLDWDRLLAKEIPPGFSPTVASETDTSNFDHLYTRDKHLESVHLPDSSDLQGGGDTTFEGFTYHEAGTMAAGSGSLGGGATPRLDSLDDGLDDS